MPACVARSSGAAIAVTAAAVMLQFKCLYFYSFSLAGASHAAGAKYIQRKNEFRVTLASPPYTLLSCDYCAVMPYSSSSVATVRNTQWPEHQKKKMMTNTPLKFACCVGGGAGDACFRANILRGWRTSYRLLLCGLCCCCCRRIRTPKHSLTTTGAVAAEGLTQAPNNMRNLTNKLQLPI